jgi:hypothetical protein
MKRASHVGYNACNARIQRVLSHLHSRVMTAFDTRFMTRLLRVCRPFMHCTYLALLARRKRAGSWITFGQYCIKSFQAVTCSDF